MWRSLSRPYTRFKTIKFYNLTHTLSHKFRYLLHIDGLVCFVKNSISKWESKYFFILPTVTNESQAYIIQYTDTDNIWMTAIPFPTSKCWPNWIVADRTLAILDNLKHNYVCCPSYLFSVITVSYIIKTWQRAWQHYPIAVRLISAITLTT